MRRWRVWALAVAISAVVVGQPGTAATDPDTAGPDGDAEGDGAVWDADDVDDPHEVVMLEKKGRVGALGGSSTSRLERVLWAVNSGGDSLVGSRGVNYLADSNLNRQASGGTEAFIPVPIRRADTRDFPLYQTERYGTTNFFYDIPTPLQEGRYTVVLKFAEVAFREPNKKIFNVILNEKHAVVKDLDIFSKVGHAAAHDEYISFTIKNNVLKYRRKSSKLEDTIRIEFVKGHNDNPKVCAVALIYGNTSLAHSLVGVEPDEMLKPDVGTSGPTQSLFPDGDDVDGRKKSRSPRKKDMLREEEDEHPLPLNSIVLGGLILALVLLYESYVRTI